MLSGTLKRQPKVGRELNLESRGRVMTHSRVREIADQDPHGRVKRDQSDTLGYLHCFKSGTRVVHVIWRSVRQSVCGCGLAEDAGPMAKFGGVFLVVDRKSSQSERRFMIFLFVDSGNTGNRKIQRSPSFQSPRVQSRLLKIHGSERFE